MVGRPNFAIDVISEKQKVFQWMRQWLKENGTEERNVASFDLPDLIILLQCAGFTLHKFQSNDEFNYTNPATIIGDTLKIELTCSKSGMRAEMLKPVQSCSCPKRDDITTEEFFSVTSYAPASKGSFDVSLSSFLPTISHPKQNVVGDIFKQLIAIIKNENEETEADTYDVRRTIERMSLDPTKSLMQNLKDIKRVVDSFLGDKEPELNERQNVLQNNLHEKIDPREKVTATVQENSVTIQKIKSKIGNNKKPLVTTKKMTSSAMKSGLTTNGDKSKTARVTEINAVKKKPLVATSSSKTKPEKVINVAQRNSTSFTGSGSPNKPSRIVRSKTVNKK